MSSSNLISSGSIWYPVASSNFQYWTIKKSNRYLICKQSFGNQSKKDSYFGFSFKIVLIMVVTFFLVIIVAMSWQIGPGRFGCFFMLSLPNENLKKNPSVRTKKFRKPYGMELGYMEQGITFLCWQLGLSRFEY